MKILKTKSHKVLMMIFIFLFTFNTLAYADYNPPREEIENMIDEVAVEMAIPSVILKSIARVESVYEHYNSNGSPLISGSSIGLMQVTNTGGVYDTNKLKYDIQYNIEAGADVLLNKWSMSSYNSVSCVGNMDPNVLENWYFALWAYNGWAQSNNPYMASSYSKKYTYQQLIYNVAQREYGQTISNIDFSYLPQSGKPSRSLVVPTPASAHSGFIVLYENGDYVRTNGVRGEYNLRDAPAGKYIHELGDNQLGIITEGPVLQNGYYWYKVMIDENHEGWIERNWLVRTGDTEHGRYVFDDIAFHWARKNIMELYKDGVVSEAASFNPDNIVTKEEFLIFLSKAINEQEELELQETNDEEVTLPFEDASAIHNWALEYVEQAYALDLLENYENMLNPLDKLTRKEAAILIQNLFEEDKEFEKLDIKTIFTDINSLNENEINAIKAAYTNGLISGKSSGNFCPDDYLTRAETAAIMVKIIDKINNAENLEN